MSNLPPETYMPIFISFSAQTNANQTQDIIDAKFERRLKGVYAPLDRKRAVIFFDDVNMPAKEVYGAQPPLELIRQLLDSGGYYNTSTIVSQFNDAHVVVYPICNGLYRVSVMQKDPSNLFGPLHNDTIVPACSLPALVRWTAIFADRVSRMSSNDSTLPCELIETQISSFGSPSE